MAGSSFPLTGAWTRPGSHRSSNRGHKMRVWEEVGPEKYRGEGSLSVDESALAEKISWLKIVEYTSSQFIKNISLARFS